MGFYYKLSFLVLGFLVVLNLTDVLAQDDNGPAVIITTVEMAMPEDGSIAEFDSLNQLYTDKVIKKNDLIFFGGCKYFSWYPFFYT